MKRYDINIDYYKILGLNINSNQQEIHKAYLVIARKFHPDLFSQSIEERERMNKAFQLVNEAYSVLKDPEIKKEYDDIRLLNIYHAKQTSQVKHTQSAEEFYGKQGTKSNTNYSSCLFFVIIMIALVIYDSMSKSSDLVENDYQKVSVILPVASPIDYPEVSLPESGFVQNDSGMEVVAPLKIITNGSNNYLVKLTDGSKDIINVFVRGGSSVDVDVPLGTFQLKYATGAKWYGYDHLFGPSTNYNKADESFDFRVEGDQVIGHSITLYQVVDGNLSTSQIKPEDF